MKYAFAPPATVTVPIVGKVERFPVRRIYCLVRNYADHAKEMGQSGADAPFFFLKAGDAEAVVVVEAGQTAKVRYPTLTEHLHPEFELVVAIGARGKNIALANAHEHVYGYALGLDMTRMDLLREMMQKGRAWCIGKSFEEAAVIGPIVPADPDLTRDIENAELSLRVNGKERQHSNVSLLIWSAATIIEQLSLSCELLPGDLIYTGTPAGVAPVFPGDIIEGRIGKLETLTARIVAS